MHTSFLPVHQPCYLHCCIRTAPASCSGTMLRCCTTTTAAAAAASARRVAASSCSSACLLPCTPHSTTQHTPAAYPLNTRAARFTCSSSSSVVVHRRFTLSAALAAVSAGGWVGVNCLQTRHPQPSIVSHATHVGMDEVSDSYQQLLCTCV